MSRKQLLDVYTKAAQHKSETKTSSGEDNSDVLRMLHLRTIRRSFAYFSTPHYPPRYEKLQEELRSESPVLNNINSFFPYVEEVKEILPQQAVYLLL